MWLAAAMGSALFAGLTAILAKLGVRNVDSDVATALRSVVILAFAWLMVFVTGSQGALGQIGARPMAFLVLSGLATGASWICYFYAVQNGPVSAVIPIDKASVLVTVAFSCTMLHERLGRREAVGLALLLAGILIIAAWS